MEKYRNILLDIFVDISLECAMKKERGSKTDLLENEKPQQNKGGRR